MKTRNYLILGAVVIGLGVAAVNVFSTGTDNNSDAVTESETNNTVQQAVTTDPSTTVEVAPAIEATTNTVESATPATTEAVDNNSTK